MTQFIVDPGIIESLITRIREAAADLKISNLIVKELANINPIFENGQGWVGCYFCGVEQITSLDPLRLDQHLDDCIWKAAKHTLTI